ncbi:MAG TPA: hypothetical protein VJH03_04255 [Blastocatellia bacterium]|nr:hypothetical protein [Blastocatellia bacterium]
MSVEETVKHKPRVTVQSSVFTLQDDPGRNLEDYKPKEFRESPKQFQIERLIRWRVPGEDRAKIVKDLNRNGIHAGTLFPDLDGAARGVVQSEIVYDGMALDQTP